MVDEAQRGENFTDAEVSNAPGICAATERRAHECCMEDGIEADVSRKDQVMRKPKNSGRAKEARLVGPDCMEPPEGRTVRTLELLRGRLVEQKVVDSIATEIVGKSVRSAIFSSC